MTTESHFVLPNYSDDLSSTFHPEIFKKLPASLRVLFGQIDNEKERDILLLGSLVVLSGCMPNVTAIYDRKTIFPNLYAFVEAPAGAGKGVLAWVRHIGLPIHQQLHEKTRLENENYLASKKEKRKNGVDNSSVPPQRMLFVPTNNSASSLMKALSENEGAAILFSTEADTLTDSLAQDWGNYSTVLRAGYQNEPVEQQRRQFSEYFSVERPRIAVLLTGTMGQRVKLIPTAENGLFSRFLYYSFPATPKFRNVFHNEDKNIEAEFKKFGLHTLGMYNYLKHRETPLELYLDSQQQAEFIKMFENLNDVTYKECGQSVLGMIHRLALSCFRIAMILTIVRYYDEENRREVNRIPIQKLDFAIAMQLSSHLLFHGSLMMTGMRERASKVVQHERSMRLYNLLPMNFTKKEAAAAAKKLDIPTSTLGRYLLEGLYKREAHGMYSKILIESASEQTSK